MRRTTVFLICLLLTLPMLAGCTGNANGDGEADPTSDASTVIINNYYNNTTNEYTTASADNPTIHYAIGGVSIEAGEMVEVLAVWYSSSTEMVQVRTQMIASCLSTTLDDIGEISPHWLPTDGGACNYSVVEQPPHFMSSDYSIVYRIHNITYEGLLTTSNPNFSPISTFQYTATDHGANTPSAATDDTLFTLQFVQAPSDLAWANLTVQIIDATGTPTTCSIGAASGNCNLYQFGSDSLTWEQYEIIHVQENGLAICSAAPCSFSVKISLDGMDLSGTSTVVAE